MRNLLFCAALLVASPARAELLPSFHLPWAAKAAADIFVVEEQKIVEVWAGDRKVGDAYPAADVVPRGYKVVYGFGRIGLPDAEAEIDRQLAEKGLKRVTKVSNKRLVFFVPPEPAKSGKERLLERHHEYSTVWLEEGQAFAIQQFINPGPAEMRPLKMTESELKQAVQKLREEE